MDSLKRAGMSLLLAASLAEAGERDPQPSAHTAGNAVTHQEVGVQGFRLHSGSRISDILNHPSFAGFSRLLLPWDDRSYDGEMQLGNISSLLPYHTHIDPKEMVTALNRMIDDASQGSTTFFDFYSEAQKRTEPSKQHTGLFFFRGKPGAPFAIIAPGGGFSYVGSVHEGFPYAVEINKKGFNAFVLKYRAGFGVGVATQDLAAAISYIFDHAETLAVGTKGYSVWGSSAGARMAASIGSHGIAVFGGKMLPKPATVVMAYTGHSDYSPDEVPTFALVGEHDGIAPPAIMERRIAALSTAGIPTEFHIYRDLGHGFGLGAGTNAEGWVLDAIRFWERFIMKR